MFKSYKIMMSSLLMVAVFSVDASVAPVVNAVASSAHLKNIQHLMSVVPIKVLSTPSRAQTSKKILPTALDNSKKPVVNDWWWLNKTKATPVEPILIFENTMEQGLANSAQWLADHKEGHQFKPQSKSWGFKSFAKKVGFGFGTLGIGAACKSMYDGIAPYFTIKGAPLTADELVDQYLKKNPEKAKLMAVEGNNKKIMIAALAVGVVSYLAYKGYQAYYYKPSFETLVQTYVYNAENIDVATIEKNFHKALKRYGYTSLEDKQRAAQVLEELNLLM